MYLPPYILSAFALTTVKAWPYGSKDDMIVFDYKLSIVEAAGIGAEFESDGFVFQNHGCSEENTRLARQQTILGHTGENWKLTADTKEVAGFVQAEYILDGRNIKVGSGALEKAGQDFVDDLKEWHPWVRANTDPFHQVTIGDIYCNPWLVTQPGNRQVGSTPIIDKIPWNTQITSAMPLEALYFLMRDNREPNPKTIFGNNNNIYNKYTVVTHEFFQSSPNNIDKTHVTDDVLGFCSLIVSYAKLATTQSGGHLAPGGSAKRYLPFMPRTEFNTIYQQVKNKLPGDHLFSLFNILACYKNDEKHQDTILLDTVFCDGTPAKPIPKENFGAGLWKSGDNKVNIRAWIEGIGKGDPSPDMLTTFDATIDGSIGGLGTRLEKIYKSERAVPIFEFRDLDCGKTTGISVWLKEVDLQIQKLHAGSFGSLTLPHSLNPHEIDL